VEDGDLIEIDIPGRSLELKVAESDLAARRERLLADLGGYRPRERHRPVTAALQAYAALTTSASTGASRDLSQLSR
jgi:dihydroxy-acid dehydratase